MQSPNRFTITGLLLILPFALANTVIGLRFEPLYTWIRFLDLGYGPPWFVIMLVCLIFVGAVIAAWPMLKKNTSGKRNVFVLNIIAALLLFSIFIFLAYVLGEEIYRCDVLQIPNCD